MEVFICWLPVLHGLGLKCVQRVFGRREAVCYRGVHVLITLSGRQLIWILFWNSKLVVRTRKNCFLLPYSLFPNIYLYPGFPAFLVSSVSALLLFCSLLLFHFRNSFFPNTLFLLHHLTKLIIVGWSTQGLPNFYYCTASFLCSFTTKGRKKIVN